MVNWDNEDEVNEYLEKAFEHGVSVTKRIKQIKQPHGGYIKPRSMSTETFGEGIEALNPVESVDPILMGISIDYLTRYMLGTPKEAAFRISLNGASIINEYEKASQMLADVIGLDKNSVVNAVKLSGYDVCRRLGASGYVPVEEITPDDATVENIITMVNRSLKFFDAYGPIVLDGLHFGAGYTDIVSSGDGDFMTRDTLWDFKVSKSKIRSNQTLQLLMYWRMGLHSGIPEYKDIKYLGIFNPRMNTVSRIAVEDIPEDVIKIVEEDVIGYEKSGQ